MTPFAFFFMIFSMACVTTLTAYCLYRILTSGPPASDNGEEQASGRFTDAPYS